MTKKIKAKVSIVLDKPRTLLLDLNAMVNFEEATGKSLFDPNTMGRMSAKDVRALLWACLHREDPELTLEDTGNLIDMSNFEDIMNKLSETWTNALPGKDDEPPLAEKPQSGIG